LAVASLGGRRAPLYARGIDAVLVIVAVAALLVVLSLGRMAWRIFRGNEQMESGGSMGHQMFGRNKKAE
jgi:hypothetical protein